MLENRGWVPIQKIHLGASDGRETFQTFISRIGCCIDMKGEDKHQIVLSFKNELLCLMQKNQYDRKQKKSIFVYEIYSVVQFLSPNCIVWTRNFSWPHHYSQCDSSHKFKLSFIKGLSSRINIMKNGLYYTGCISSNCFDRLLGKIWNSDSLLKSRLKYFQDPRYQKQMLAYLKWH